MKNQHLRRLLAKDTARVLLTGTEMAIMTTHLTTMATASPMGRTRIGSKGFKIEGGKDSMEAWSVDMEKEGIRGAEWDLALARDGTDSLIITVTA